MRSDVLDGARVYAFQPQKHTQVVVVVRHGVIVAEWYEAGRDERAFGTNWSVAKSFTSALVGIAIEEGLVESVDVRMAEFFPEWRGTDREAIRKNFSVSIRRRCLTRRQGGTRKPRSVSSRSSK